MWPLVAVAAGAAANYFAGREANKATAKANQKNIALQREFANNGITMKVADARKAGIAPLAALGASTVSPSMSYQPEDGMAQAMANTGQDLSRAIAATSNSEDREAQKLNLALARTQLNGAELDNQLKLSQLQKLNSVGPAMPTDADKFIPGQGDSGLVKVVPKERINSAPGKHGQEAGWVPDLGFSRTATGLTPVVPESLSESLEDDIIGKFLWRIRNNAMPNFGNRDTAPSDSMLPKGYDAWEWSYSKQEWQPVKDPEWSKSPKNY